MVYGQISTSRTHQPTLSFTLSSCNVFKCHFTSLVEYVDLSASWCCELIIHILLSEVSLKLVKCIRCHCPPDRTISNSSPGGVRPSTLFIRDVGAPQKLIFTDGWRRNISNERRMHVSSLKTYTAAPGQD